MTKPPAAPPELLQGIVQTLTFFNSENGYFVARVNVPGKGERTVVGHAPVITVGEQITAKGTWQSSSWGPQFKALETSLSAPTAMDGIEKYLANGFEGIGKGYAKKLVAAFGEDVFDVIEKTPEKLFDVKGIGKKRAESIINAYAEQVGVRKVMVFLHKIGLSTNRAKKVFDRYGAKSIQTIKENPYVLCKDIWGVGFSSADAVANSLGVTPDSDYRITAGIHHVLREAEGQGSCGLPEEMVLDQASLLLKIDFDSVRRCIQYEVESEQLIRADASGQTCLFLPTVYKNEQRIARMLLEHKARVPSPIPDLEQRLTDAQVELGIMLEDAQLEAVRVAISNSVCVITGGPGTGKTTITRVVLHVLMNAGVTSIAIAAPTGKAAKRASEATGQPALTIHRLLEFDKNGGFKRNEKNPLDARGATLLDESSMADVSIMASTLSALNPESRFIIIGDVDQLPSVGPGKVLSDIIESGVLPTVRLTVIRRQAAGSDIIANAHAINRGEMPMVGHREGSDFCFWDISPKEKDDEAEKKRCRTAIEAEILRLARDMYKLGYDPIRDVQVLAPMRRGQLGVEALNVKLQAILNPEPSAVLDVFGAKWGVGDKVMQIRNNYDKNVYNGDIGYIEEIDAKERTMWVDFDGTKAFYKSADLEELRLAYAFTIHKSQGSEFPVVIMPVSYDHWTMLKRNLLYTGVTRARKLCVIVGQKQAVRVAVQTAQNEERYSRLKEWLRAGLPREMKLAA